MLHCHECHEEAFLIRGLCEHCDPKAHAEYEAWRALVGEAGDAYEEETGKSSLDDWDDFEAYWAREYGDWALALIEQYGLPPAVIQHRDGYHIELEELA